MCVMKGCVIVTISKADFSKRKHQEQYRWTLSNHLKALPSQMGFPKVKFLPQSCSIVRYKKNNNNYRLWKQLRESSMEGVTAGYGEQDGLLDNGGAILVLW